MDAIMDNHISIPSLLLGAVVLYVLYTAAVISRKNARILRLGARAPIRPKYAPWGLDFVYDYVGYALKDQMYEMWVIMYQKWAGPNHYTIEAGASRRMIFTAEPENIKAILATQFKEYGKGEQFRKDWHAFLGDGIFTTDGQLWHNSRQLIRPQFIKDRLSNIEVFEEHVQILLSMIGHKQEVDTLDLMFRYTLDIATHFLLGHSVNSLQNPESTFAEAFSNAQRVQVIVQKLGPLNWLIPRKRMGFYDSINTINDFVSGYIETAIAMSSEEDADKLDNNATRYNFLHAIAGYTNDRQKLRDQLVSTLLAGRDTTACTLTWAIYHLSIEPRITAKLRQEIIDTVGYERTPTYQDLKDMKYLQNIVNETLRLYPIVPYNIRVALTDTTLPTGGGKNGQQKIGILKGTQIAYSPLVMQRRKDLYPLPETGFPAVDQFVPERWENWTPRSWTYIPFNGGPRICIGQQFALTEMGYTLVRLFQCFQTVENRMDGVQPGLRSNIVLQPIKVVKVAFC